MIKKKLLVKLNSNRTTDVDLDNSELIIKMLPFTSEIKSLRFHYENASGTILNRPISNTENSFELRVIGGAFWLEYSSTDKEYEIEFLIS